MYRSLTNLKSIPMNPRVILADTSFLYSGKGIGSSFNIYNRREISTYSHRLLIKIKQYNHHDKNPSMLSGKAGFHDSSGLKTSSNNNNNKNNRIKNREFPESRSGMNSYVRSNETKATTDRADFSFLSNFNDRNHPNGNNRKNKDFGWKSPSHASFYNKEMPRGNSKNNNNNIKNNQNAFPGMRWNNSSFSNNTATPQHYSHGNRNSIRDILNTRSDSKSNPQQSFNGTGRSGNASEFKNSPDGIPKKTFNSRKSFDNQGRTFKRNGSSPSFLNAPGKGFERIKDSKNIFEDDVQFMAEADEDYSMDSDIRHGSKRKFREKKTQRPSNYLTENDNVRNRKDKKDNFKNKKTKGAKVKQLKEIVIPDVVSVNALSKMMGLPTRKLQFALEKTGLENVTAEFILTSEQASDLVLDFDMIPITHQITEYELSLRPQPESWDNYPFRPPVVTIMGHVDHGKTTLLDSLRKTSVAQSEAGGITQHIGAFSVKLPSGKQITFLDTPGHAAFSSMRSRGAKTTDIVILVVAADDGVKPQTTEAIQHTIAAKAPMIVAINKCDKPNINIKRVKEDLLANDVILEDYGGEIQSVEVSALSGKGLSELEENIIALSEFMDIRGDPSGTPEGVVIESKLDKGKGNTATVLVKRGTLKVGDVIVAGQAWAKVRIMMNDQGEAVREAAPSDPVEISGWKVLPEAGDIVIGSETEDMAKKVIQSRTRKADLERQINDMSSYNAARTKNKEKVDEVDELTETEQDSGIPKLKLILKADVHGSLEAITQALEGLPQHEVSLEILDSGVGGPAESEIEYARDTGSKVISFNLPQDKRINALATTFNVNVFHHNIIYKLIDDVKDMMTDLLPKEEIIQTNGEAIIQQVFEITVKKTIERVAGCRILSGKIVRNGQVRLVRNGEEIWRGSLKSLKHVKKDINEAAKGTECGMALDGFSNIQEGDHIQNIEILYRKAKLT